MSANAFLSGQTGYDLTEDTVREVADAVRTRLLFLILGSSRCTLAASGKPPEEGVAGGASLALLVLGAPELTSISVFIAGIAPPVSAALCGVDLDSPRKRVWLGFRDPLGPP